MRPQCPGCQDIYSSRNPPEHPPCYNCRVDLIDSNIDAAKVYDMAKNQVILSAMGEPRDINIPAVKIVMDLFGIHNQISCLNKVRSLFFYFDAIRRKSEG